MTTKENLLHLNKFIGKYNRPYLSKTILKDDFVAFLDALTLYSSAFKTAETAQETEEHFKGLFPSLLKTFPLGDTIINTYDRIDLTLMTPDKGVEVMIEFKRPTNKSEMITSADFNKKALHEALHYFYKYKNNNLSLKYIIITNGDDTFIFDSRRFGNDAIKTLCDNFNAGDLLTDTTPKLYAEIKNIIYREKIVFEDYCYFSIKDLSENLQKAKDYIATPKTDTDETQSFPKLVALYKIFHPDFLLRRYKVEDSNSLNNRFYKELLYILGLEEKKAETGNAIIIAPTNLSGAVATQVQNEIKKKGIFKQQDNTFGLITTWLNRILFLKLFEGQLVSFNNNKNIKFLTSDKIKNWNDLDDLFFGVLGTQTINRSAEMSKFADIPYLNSSLFEESQTEKHTRINISNINDNNAIPIMRGSVLGVRQDYAEIKINQPVNTLKYLLDFLDAYDFGADEAPDILRAENKDIINSAVLGLIFEKLNGYKDGSVYTPGHITEYMAQQSIEKAVVDKFNTAFDWDAETISELKNHMGLISKHSQYETYNAIFNSITICDPAVGSGHFLVSVLYRLIAIKAKLGLLWDGTDKILTEVSVENDILTLLDENERTYGYKRELKASHSIQKTIFNEKKTIIENMLFGVDINPNSVEICRLRLWIELLKNTYYTDTHTNEMAILPNIDINIKCGNSLVQKFPVKVGTSALDTVDKRAKEGKKIKAYKKAVSDYKHSQDKLQKTKINDQLDTIKGSLYSIAQLDIFNTTSTANLYENSMEWMIEFPEVLDDNGVFLGFDVIIGNPPYIQIQSFSDKSLKDYWKEKYKVFMGTSDIYCLFYELGTQLASQNGTIQYITSNKFMRAGYGEKMRAYFANNTNIYTIIDLGAGIFDSVTVDSVIVYVGKNTETDTTVKTYTIQNKAQAQKLNATLENHSTQMQQSDFTGDTWALMSADVYRVMQKIKQDTIPLGDYVKGGIQYGIKTGYNEAFIIDKKTKDKLTAQDPNSADLIKPMLKGKNIKRWHPDFQELYLIMIASSQNKKWAWSNAETEKQAETIFMDIYPAIAKYLIQHKKPLKERTDKGNFYWELRSCVYYESFEKPKIMYPDIRKNFESIYDNNQYYTGNTAYIIPTPKEYLQPILSSKVLKIYFNNSITDLGSSGRRFFSQFMEKLPIKKPDTTTAEKLSELAQQCQDAKAENPKADISELEQQIDEIVYKLYNLTKDEIKIIEKNV